MPKHQRWTLGPLPEEPGDLFGVRSGQKRIRELELALAYCVEQLNEALSAGRPLDEDERWDPESIIAQAVQDEEYRLAQLEEDDGYEEVDSISGKTRAQLYAEAGLYGPQFGGE